MGICSSPKRNNVSLLNPVRGDQVPPSDSDSCGPECRPVPGITPHASHQAPAERRGDLVQPAACRHQVESEHHHPGGLVPRKGLQGQLVQTRRQPLRGRAAVGAGRFQHHAGVDQNKRLRLLQQGPAPGRSAAFFPLLLLSPRTGVRIKATNLNSEPKSGHKGDSNT